MTRIASFVAAAALVLAAGACKKDESTPSTAAPQAQAKPAVQPPVAQTPAAQPEQSKAEASVGMVTPGQLATLIASKSCDVFDANSDKTRAAFGKVPTAVLLKGGSDYDLGQLPADKARKLVFYCANTQCGASHRSAEKALAAGYTDVNVMPEGVMGWKESGHQTEKVM